MSDGRLTLAFRLKALDRLAEPGAAVADARTWSEFVGVVSNRPASAVIIHLREHDVHGEDFLPLGDIHATLEKVLERSGTDRHVFVGVSDADKRRAEATGWEYLPLEDAAARAGWKRSIEAVER